MIYIENNYKQPPVEIRKTLKNDFCMPYDPHFEENDSIILSDSNRDIILTFKNNIIAPIELKPQKIKINKDTLSTNNIEEVSVICNGVNAKYPIGINGLNLDRIERFIMKEIKDFKSNYQEGYSLNITYELFPSDEYIGVLVKILTDTLGAHPSTNIMTFTVGLSGVRSEYRFKNLDELSTLAKEKLKANLENDEMYVEDIFNSGLAPKPENFRFAIEQEDSFIFFFPQYQIAPYAAGIQQVEIPKSEIILQK